LRYVFLKNNDDIDSVHIQKIPYRSTGHVYIVNGDGNGDGDGDGDGHVQFVSTSRKSLRNALQELGFNVMTFQGPAIFLRELKFSRELKLSLPAVLLFDTRLHDWCGVTLQSDLSQFERAVPIIFLGSNNNSKEIVTSMRQGAVDFLTQPFTLQDICAVIKNAMAMNVESSARHLGDDDLKTRLRSLTTREREICFLMVQGYGNIGIAALNNSAAGTVKIHRRRVLKKLGVDTLAGLVSQINPFDHLHWHMTN
jgi:two-component system response regulator FixJ